MQTWLPDGVCRWPGLILHACASAWRWRALRWIGRYSGQHLSILNDPTVYSPGLRVLCSWQVFGAAPEHPERPDGGTEDAGAAHVGAPHGAPDHAERAYGAVGRRPGPGGAALRARPRPALRATHRCRRDRQRTRVSGSNCARQTASQCVRINTFSSVTIVRCCDATLPYPALSAAQQLTCCALNDVAGVDLILPAIHLCET